jgi:hypothetical protein
MTPPQPPRCLLVTENFNSKLVSASELSAHTSCKFGRISERLTVPLPAGMYHNNRHNYTQLYTITQFYFIYTLTAPIYLYTVPLQAWRVFWGPWGGRGRRRPRFTIYYILYTICYILYTICYILYTILLNAMHIHLCIYTSIHIYIHTYIHIYIHTYIIHRYWTC